jgi:hypothetical protein
VCSSVQAVQQCAAVCRQCAAVCRKEVQTVSKRYGGMRIWGYGVWGVWGVWGV